MKTKIRITIAEDLTLMRRSLVSLLQEDPRLQIVAEAANGRELLNSLEKNPADVILVDLEMPVMNGWAAAELVRLHHPGVKIIILSMYADLTYEQVSAEKGIHCYLTKGCDANILFEAIHTVFDKGSYTDHSLKIYLQNCFQKNLPEEGSSLNDKETQILKHICEGKTNKEMAAIFGLSPSTVDFHRSKIYNKTNSSNIADLFKYALKRRIISIL